MNVTQRAPAAPPRHRAARTARTAHTARLAAWMLGGLVLASLATLSPPATAQADKNAERATRRLQMQLQSLQEQLSAAQAAKQKAEGEKGDVDKRLQTESQTANRARGALRQAEASAKALEAERNELKARVAALETQLTEQKQSGAEALSQREKESKQALAARDADKAQLQARLDQQVTLVAECTVKNARLVALGAELLQRWRTKGVSDVVSQKESLLGFGDVQMFNLVQDYRDRVDADRFKPATGR